MQITSHKPSAKNMNEWKGLNSLTLLQIANGSHEESELSSLGCRETKAKKQRLVSSNMNNIVVGLFSFLQSESLCFQTLSN